MYFKDGTSINIDGTVHDAKNGTPQLSNSVKNGLRKTAGKQEVYRRKVFDMQIGIVDRNTDQYIEAKNACLVCTLEELGELKEFIDDFLASCKVYCGENGCKNNFDFTHTHFSLFSETWRPGDSDIEIVVRSKAAQ